VFAKASIRKRGLSGLVRFNSEAAAERGDMHPGIEKWGISDDPDEENAEVANHVQNFVKGRLHIKTLLAEIPEQLVGFEPRKRALTDGFVDFDLYVLLH
jgi:hypothetical protein